MLIRCFMCNNDPADRCNCGACRGRGMIAFDGTDAEIVRYMMADRAVTACEVPLIPSAEEIADARYAIRAGGFVAEAQARLRVIQGGRA